MRARNIALTIVVIEALLLICIEAGWEVWDGVFGFLLGSALYLAYYAGKEA